MKRNFFVLCAFITLFSFGALAQNKKEVTTFQEAYARNIEPQAKIYVKPQTCDLKYLSTDRQEYGPYEYKFKGDLTDVMLENFKNRALFQACLEDEADMMVGALFNSSIDDSEPNVLKVQLLAYPVKFINFRALDGSANDYEMVRSVYPSAIGAVDKAVEELKNTGKKTN